MFTPPRFVVIDDKAKHLDAILNVFQELGSPCQGVLYNPEDGINEQHLAGVRALFVDLHLTDTAATTDEKRHFGLIASILEGSITPAGGPFILVVWTEHDHVVNDLTKFLDESLDPDRPHARPLAIASLSKRQFIDLDTGRPNDTGAAALLRAVEQTVSSQPQLRALVEWESNVQAAAGATLSALADLVPDDKRISASFPSGINEILSRLAGAAVGQDHVATDPRAAVAAALAPILADRIVNQDVPDTAKTMWREAVTWPVQETKQLDATRAGKVNRMLHVAVPPSETIRSTDWGTVVEFPAAWWNNDDELERRFGLKRNVLLGGEYKIERKDRNGCRPRLVRLGAVCDHAQNRTGPLLYLLGLEIPDTVKRKKDKTGTVRLSAAEWSSPVFLLAADSGPFILAVNTRYWVTVAAADTANWNPVYRLREQLLMHLISHASSHMARPGIVQL